MWTTQNRIRYDRSALRYPSDLTDDEWAYVEPLIPPARRGGNKRHVDVREVMNGIMYVLSTGCQWRAIPKDLPPRSTVHDYLDLWSYDGTLDRIHHALYVECREQGEREASPTAAIIDSQSVKSAEKGGPVSIRMAMMRARRSRARSSSNARLLGSTAAEGLPRIGRASTARRWRSCASHQSASCSENFVIPPDVPGQTLSKERVPKGAAWQPVAMRAVSAVALPFRRLVPQSWHARELAWTAGKALVAGWPAALVIAGGIGFVAYQHVALDPTAYAIETRTYTFWDPLLVGTISASHELTALYGMGESPYSDTMGYFIARKYLVEHNDKTSPIAVVQDGKVVGSFAMHNMGAYDAVLRRVFFEMVRQHPWLVLRAFVYDKPRAELRMLSKAAVFYRPGIFSFTVLLAIVSGVIIWALGAPAIRREHVLTATRVAFLTGMLSLSTTFITPTPYIPDTMLFFLLLLLIVPACAPLLIKAKLWHRSAIIIDPRRRRRTRVPSPR